MKPGDLVIIRPFPDYYPDWLAKTEELVGKSGIIVEMVNPEFPGASESWLILIGGLLLEFGLEELELKNA
jgi:hypothetical protein